jgi:dienelactone hydrolase
MKLEENTKHAMRLKVCPGAHHLFDVEAPEWVVTGQTMAYDEAASMNAFRQARLFFDGCFE